MNAAARSDTPVAEGERLVAIDTLRGVAVLGILVMNIYVFAMSSSAYMNPLAMGGTEWHNIATWYVTHLLFDQKFLTIFSILFGAGLAMMSARAEQRGTTMGRNWFRRNVWLLLIGVAHGYLLWMGDILYSYAVIGLLIYPFRHQSPRALIIIGCLLLPVGTFMTVSAAGLIEYVRLEAPAVQAMQDAGEDLTENQQAILDTWNKLADDLRPPEEIAAEDQVAYLQGYRAIVEHRAPEVREMQTTTFLAYTLWRVGGLMLIGMALFKLGILSAARDPAFYRKMILGCYGLGLPLVLLSAWQAGVHQFDLLWMTGVGGIPNYFGSILVGLGHTGLVMIIFKSGALSSLMTRFAAVGRMAFTNYLMHSVILTTVFYGYGLGLYGQVPRIWQMVIVAAVLALQLWLSPRWLQRFRFGPAEWAWRSLTYWQRQPMRRAANA